MLYARVFLYWIRLDEVKQYTTDAHKTASKRVILKTVEANGNLIGNNTKINTNKIIPKKIQIIHRRIIKRLIYKQKKNR